MFRGPPPPRKRALDFLAVSLSKANETPKPLDQQQQPRAGLMFSGEISGALQVGASARLRQAWLPQVAYSTNLRLGPKDVTMIYVALKICIRSKTHGIYALCIFVIYLYTYSYR